jgi:hypothetical protein
MTKDKVSQLIYFYFISCEKSKKRIDYEIISAFFNK